jgi:Uma2 family endonuclease
MTVVPTQPPPPRVKRWTKREYNELVERGAFRGQHVYLFRGELIEMPPQFRPGAYAVTKLTSALHAVFGVNAGFEIRIQLPFETPGDSMPEPDGLACTEAQNLRRPHPDQALLVVEVADGSLAEDRQKAYEYAAANVPEYWIIDVNGRRIEVYRDPTPDPVAILGFSYAGTKNFNAGESIEPLCRPGAKVSITQFFR